MNEHEMDAYDERMESRDNVKVKHLRRIADAAERIADALEREVPAPRLLPNEGSPDEVIAAIAQGWADATDRQ